MSKPVVFISYTRKDIERASLFASLLTQNGYDVWMDVKSITIGDNFVSAIADGICKADIYMLLISHNSNNSPWVAEELNIALAQSIEKKKPRIIPVLLDDCLIPSVVSGRIYLDARKSIQDALEQLNGVLPKHSKDCTTVITTPNTPVLTGVVFGLSKETDVQIGPFCEGLSKEDLIKDREKVQRLLRKRANGILMNFVPLSDFDLQSPMPKYKNGVYDEYIEQEPGDTASSICEKVYAKVTLFNPNPKKIDELVKSKLDKLDVTSLTYTFSLPNSDSDFGKKCMQRVQDNYSIISYDFEDGATIEYDSDFLLSIKCTNEQLQLKIQTEHDFLFSRNATKFVPDDFIKWLIK